MRFSKLRLNGFKSFVDTTDLIIADGLTGVVGPNGCGKSNLLEALRWVMGENRPKTMRGGNMEDVIFAGASTRPARNFAEVTLLIDNEAHLAPAAFNHHASIEIIRRITRDAGSAYKVSGKDARARDVQMLFADASTGAHSPALVRQGMISELINSKPKARRRVLEEAAGISGLYQRRHEAELKLKGAEANLERVDDIVEHLGQQLSQLAKQAKQAERYRMIGQTIRHVNGQLWARKWLDADAALSTVKAELSQHIKHTAQAERQARDAIEERQTQEQALPSLRDENAVATALVQRVELEQNALQEEERRAQSAITTLQKRVSQLDKDIEREHSLNTDTQEAISKLEWEAQELGKSAQGHPERMEHAQRETDQAAHALAELETTLSQATDHSAQLSARHSAAQRALSAAQTALNKVQHAQEASRQEQAAVVQKIQAAQSTWHEAQETQEATAAAFEDAATRLSGAESTKAAAQQREQSTRQAKAEVEGETQTIRSEVKSLQRITDKDRSSHERLLDLIEVQVGYEKAIGAALGDDATAPLYSKEQKTGWRDLMPDLPSSFASNITPLTQFVSAPPALDRRLSFAGLISPDCDPTTLQESLSPGQCLVSQAGDLWRWDGFCQCAEQAPNAAARRLEQINTYKRLSYHLEQLEHNLQASQSAHQLSTDQLYEATQAEKFARFTQRSAEQALSAAERNVSQAEIQYNLQQGQHDALALSASRLAQDVHHAQSTLKSAQTEFEQLTGLEQAQQELEQCKTHMTTARQLMMDKRAAFEELRRAEVARTRRQQLVQTELSNWRHRQQGAQSHMQELTHRREASAQDLGAALQCPNKLAEQHNQLDVTKQDVQARQGRSKTALEQGERSLSASLDHERQCERGAAEAREQRARHDALVEAAKNHVSDTATLIQSDGYESPEQLLSHLELSTEKTLPSDKDLEHELQRLKRQRENLGAVNLRAAEDAEDIQSEYNTLTSEKADLESAISALRSGIANLNSEGRERLLAAFDTVNTNFAMLFKHLFAGGEAKLVLVESDDPLDAGLEILCQPPGKKLSTLSLLSGGEQTLTALALIFAVFLANPAPICVLDEVDAPLDDANVTRFCDLLDEMTRQTQTRFLIITHHAVTMTRMDRLFGVTMGEQGVSQLVSVDLKKASELVA